MYRSDKTKAGRAIDALWSGPKHPPSLWSLSALLMGGSEKVSWDFMSGYGAQIVGEHVIVSTRAGAPAPTIPTCTPIKASEFWAMVEAIERAP